VLTTYEYDAAGRLASSITKAAPGGGCSERHPFGSETRDYKADGSVRIERFDYMTDVVNETVTIDGEMVFVWHSMETRSAACAAVDAATAPRAGNECHVQ
jgi:hypothetical protein